MKYLSKTLALGLVAAMAFSSVSCKAGRSHTLKQTVTDPKTGVVTELEFESGITALNQKMAWELATFEESLGLNGSIWKSSGEAGGVATSPETRFFESLENFAAISRNLQQTGAPPEAEDRLDRIERLIEERLLTSSDSAPASPPAGRRAAVTVANGETRILALTPDEVTQLEYLRGLRDAPALSSDDSTPPAD